MLVINHQQSASSGGGRPSIQTEKILLSMSKLAVSNHNLLLLVEVL